MRSVWSNVLGVDECDLDGNANFFEMGGDSALALRLIETAKEKNLHVDYEAVFRQSTLTELANNSQEYGQPTNTTHTPSNAANELVFEEGIIHACASACQCDRELIEDIFPASPLQEAVLSRGESSHGTLVMQWVFQIRGKLDRGSLREAWNELHRKNQIMRTRLVKLGDDALQVVLKADLNWQEGNSLSEYKAHSFGHPLTSTQPLFRYAIIEEQHESYFVWTGHHCGNDSGTRRMIFEDLQNILSHPPYTGKSDRTSYKTFVEWSQSRDNTAALAYWESRLASLQPFGYIYPLSLEHLPTTTSRFSKTLPRERLSNSKSKFTISTMAHAAWSISLGNISGRDDIFYETTRLGRQIPISGAESIVGPVVAAAPVRTGLRKDQSIEDMLQSMQEYLVSIIPHERDGLTVALKILGTHQIHQSFFSWHSYGDDVFREEIVVKNPEGSIARLQPREDLSPLFSTNYGLTLDGYEHKDHLVFHTSWDHKLQSKTRVEQLIDGFVDTLSKIMAFKAQTVGDLWPIPGQAWEY